MYENETDMNSKAIGCHVYYFYKFPSSSLEQEKENGATIWTFTSNFAIIESQASSVFG